MKIKFLVPYLGRETAGKFHDRGEVVELPLHSAMLELISLGIVEEVKERGGVIPESEAVRSEPDPQEVIRLASRKLKGGKDG